MYCTKPCNLSQCMRFPTMWYVRPAKPQISLRIRAVWSMLCKSLEYSMTLKLLTEHHLEFLSLKGGYKGSSESTLVKMSHCWKSHAAAQIFKLSFWNYEISILKGSLTLAMGKCLWFSVKIKVCQSSLSSPWSYPDLSTLWLWNPLSILNASKMENFG